MPVVCGSSVVSDGKTTIVVAVERIADFSNCSYLSDRTDVRQQNSPGLYLGVLIKLTTVASAVIFHLIAALQGQQDRLGSLQNTDQVALRVLLYYWLFRRLESHLVHLI